MKLDTVGVVGAGVMGVGVAQNLAQSGFQVRLIDVSALPLTPHNTPFAVNFSLPSHQAPRPAALSLLEIYQ